MPEASAKPRPSWKDSGWSGLIPAAIAFVVMAWLGWRKWPDPIVDFGGQLYIPWQLSTGSVLYRDVMYLPGPVSQYYHALLFKLFGVSLTTILVSNLAILIGFVVLVYRMFLKVADRLTAQVISLAVVVGFAFAEYLDVGNYNYICPYSHEIWHAIVLAVLLIGCFANWFKTAHWKWLAFGGLSYGTIFLTKPENFVAASVVVLGAMVLSRMGPNVRNRSFRSWLLFGLASLLPLVGMFFVFFSREDFNNSLRGVCWAWVPLVTTHMAQGPFFQTGMGLDAPFYHVRMMLQHFVVFAAIVFVCAWRFRSTQNRIERLALFCVLAGLALNFDWTQSGRALPLILLCAVGTIFFRWKQANEDDREKLVVPLLWILFSLFLLLKMGLHTRIFHYGVFLAMPAFLGAVYFVLWLLPQSFASRIDKPSYRMIVATLLVVGLARLAIHSALFYKDKDEPVGQGGDRIVAFNPKISPAGRDVNLAVEWLKANAAPDATVAALPEGAMINYLSRHRNPTPYIVFMSEIYAFGEEKMAAPYRQSPPDYLLLVHRETGEYGLGFFGQEKGYGLDMMQWIDANYETAQLIGDEPLKTGKFGIKILKKKSR